MKKSISLLILTIIIMFLNNACTIIGGYLGSRDTEIEFAKADSEILNLSAGDEIEVIQQNGETSEGTFSGFNKLSVQDYSEMYNNYLMEQGGNILLPNLSQKYFINQKRNVVTLTGFDFGTICYDSASQGLNKNLSLKRVTFLLDSSGQKFTHESVQKLLSETRVPLYSQIVLKNERDTYTHKSEGISKILIKNKWGLGKGMLLGLVIDVVLTYLAFKDFSLLSFPKGRW